MENNKNKKSVKFQGDMLNFCDFIQVFVFTRNHHLTLLQSESAKNIKLIPAHTKSIHVIGTVYVMNVVIKFYELILYDQFYELIL